MFLGMRWSSAQDKGLLGIMNSEQGLEAELLQRLGPQGGNIDGTSGDSKAALERGFLVLERNGQDYSYEEVEFRFSCCL